MKNTFKISGLLFMILMLILLSPSITAADFPAEFEKVSDSELAAIEGMGNIFEIVEIAENGYEFSYSGNRDNALQNASGIISVSNVSGNGNTVQNIIDLKVWIMNINGNINIDIDDLGQYLQEMNL